MKKIIFIPNNKVAESVLDPPKPSAKKIPSWFKNLSPYIEKGNRFHKDFYLNTNLTAKTCPPIFDSISAGYLIEFPCDVHFIKSTSNQNNFKAVWDVSWKVLESHSEYQVGDMGIPENFDKNAWKLMGNWRVRTPRGYSVLYTHPFYRYDLPFIAATGIVDSDVYDTEINIPFFIKKNFVGTIKKGTPIAQIIPIKRDSWQSQVLPYEDDYEFIKDKIKLISKGAYKKLFWQNKKYN